MPRFAACVPRRAREDPGHPRESREFARGLTGAKDGLNGEARSARRSASASRRAIPRQRRPRMHRQTPLGALIRGIVSGAIGTAAMDMFLFSRYRRGGGERGLVEWESSAGMTSWEDAPAPAHVGNHRRGIVRPQTSADAGALGQQRDALGVRNRQRRPVRPRRWIAAGTANPLRVAVRSVGLGQRLRDPAGGQALRADLEVRRQDPRKGSERTPRVRPGHGRRTAFCFSTRRRWPPRSTRFWHAKAAFPPEE
jgi:hypothetical protein